MEYTVQKLGRLAGVSTRTLRYYDEIGILKPARINSSGYRIYGQAEVDRLQQILFYRELGVSLESINDIVTSPYFDGACALREHRERLLQKREQLDLLIANVDKTIALTEGRIKMTDKEKFEGFKQKMIDDNDKKYGKEVRDIYGKDAVEKSNNKLKNMTQEEYDAVTKLAEEQRAILAEALKQAILQVSWLRKLVICIRSGFASIGTVTLKKPMQALQKCTLMMKGLQRTMTKSSLERQNFSEMRYSYIPE